MGFFRHHRAVPLGFEYEVYDNRFYAFDRFDFHFDVFHNEFGCRTVRRSECHVESDVTIVGVDAIDESEVVDIDRDFRVVNGFEHRYDAFFKFEKFVHNQ